ncbi:N-acetylmuramoyl-L-alanine amidase [Portibacter marinus]|uniref:N-acetylmuramoyl-L-alanine amidase n=1 Tax=Portibacter marinus TaxID=2898660 RepID=UPI001F44724B|nr:N-acetylmuramoyl-L-alanine amidase [Portibacter marinus]
MYRFAISAVINILLLVTTSSASATYLKVTAEKGDGVYSLLRKYKLADEYCNIQQFYKINNLSANAHLFSGEKYYIPVLIYDYNGRSIRSTIGNDDWDLAVSIQKYNEAMQSQGQRSHSYQASKQLWVPFSSLYCNKSVPKEFVTDDKKASDTKVASQKLENIPIAETNINKIEAEKVETPEEKSAPPTKRTYEVDKLFGKAYEKIEVVDRSLKDKVFYIVSGHGGPDPGTMCETCPSTLCEDEYAYDVALRLARNLRQHGAVVEIIIQDEDDGIRDDLYLKCDRDERCNGQKLPYNQKRRLEQRVAHINALYLKHKKAGYKDHAVIALHVDAAGKGTRKDVFFYHHEKSSRGKELAHNIHDTFKSKYDRFQKGRGYKGTIRTRGLYMINYTNPPIVYIELANIKNPQDQKRILLNTNRQALANWIFQGVIK